MAFAGFRGQGPRLRRMWHLAWPAIIEQVLNTMVSYVDAAMVGVLGAVGTAAVSVNGPPIWFIGGILAGMGVGYAVQVSNAVGAGDPEQVRRVVRQSFLAVLVCGVGAGLLYQVLGGLIPRWLGAKPEVLPHAVAYLRIYTAALPFQAMLMTFGAVLRCMGNTKTPLLYNTAANLLNLVLNFFLIYPSRRWRGVLLPGLGLGVEGAAIASALSIVCAGVCAAWAVLRQRGYETSLRGGLAPEGAIVRRAVKLGVPSAIERGIINLGQIAMTGLVGHALTTAAMAANSIATTAEGLCYLPAFGIGAAATTLVGQSVGAGDREDAGAYGTLTGAIGFLLCVFTGVLLYLFAAPLAALFNSDPEVVREAARVLRVVSVSEPFFALSIVLTGALRGADDVRFPMLMGLGCMWLVRVPLACLLVLRTDLGLAGVWCAMAVDLILRGILCALRWRSGRWARLAGLERA